MKKAALVCFLLLMTASIIYPLREYLGYTNLLYWLISSLVFLQITEFTAGLSGRFQRIRVSFELPWEGKNES